MRVLRPDRRAVSLEGWFLKNFHPGIMDYLTVELRLSEEELAEEFRIWRRFTRGRLAGFYPGILDALKEYRSLGGKTVVVSHSEKRIIEWHYGVQGFLPDLILGWVEDETKRKPSPWPVYRVLEVFNAGLNDILVVDDLKPGVLMARQAGVRIAAAGWGHRIALIEDYMRATCDMYLRSIDEFRDTILQA